MTYSVVSIVSRLDCFGVCRCKKFLFSLNCPHLLLCPPQNEKRLGCEADHSSTFGNDKGKFVPVGCMLDGI